MPRRRRIDKKRRSELTMEETFELTIGPHHSGSAFPSDAARRAAWVEHRDELLAMSPDTPPCWAARQYDGALKDDDEPPEPWKG